MSGNHIIYGIKIAGLGATNSDLGGDVDPADYATSPDKDTLLYRICTSISDQDPSAQVARPLLAMPPDEIGYEVRPWEAASITGSLSVSIQLNPDTLAWFTRQSFPISARLLTTLDNSTTTVITDDYDWLMEGTYQFIGRECIYFHTAEATPGQFTVSRGQLFTAAQPHVVSPAYDTGLYAADRPHNLPGRRVEVVRWVNGTGLLEDVEEYVWAGVIQHYRVNYSTLTVDLECASLEDVLREGEICLSPWQGRLVEGGQPLPDPNGGNRSISGVYEAVQSDKPILQQSTITYIASDGTEATYTSAVFSDETLSFRSRIIGANLVVASLDAPQDCSPTLLSKQRTDLSDKIREVYDLTSTSSSLPDLIYKLITRSDDRGLGADPALLAPDFVARGESALPSSALPDSLIVGIDGPVNVYELISSLLAPYLVTLYTNPAGQLDLLPFVDRELIGGDELDDDDVVLGSTLDYDPIAVPPAAKIKAEVGAHTGADRIDNITVIAPQVRDRYLESFASTAELKLVGRTSLDSGQAICTNYAAFRSQARGIISLDVLGDRDFGVGKSLLTSLAEIPDNEGSVASGGMQGETCTILSRAYNHDDLIITYKLLRGAAGTRKASIHLSAQVASYVSGSCYIDANTYITSGGHPSGWLDDLDAWNATMQRVFDEGGSSILVDILDENLTQQGTGSVVQVFTGGSGYLQLDTISLSVTPVAGDIIVPRGYSDAEGHDEILFRYFAYVSDDDEELGGDDDPAYRWSI